LFSGHEGVSGFVLYMLPTLLLCLTPGLKEMDPANSEVKLLKLGASFKLFISGILSQRVKTD
jgi:hypothetical protein